MFVSSYQIHNVLNVYSKQLSQERGTRQKPAEKKALSDQINLSAEGKRRATMEKVARDILSKISHYGARVQIRADEQSRSRKNADGHFKPDNKNETAFVYNVIDNLNKKRTTALSVKDSNFLINRLEQLAKGAVEKNGDG